MRLLQDAVAVRCQCIDTPLDHAWQSVWQERLNASAKPLLPPAPVLILFSGGVDSTLLAAFAHKSLPRQLPIDLASICFDGGNSPDRLAALDALQELQAFAPTRQWRLIEVNATLADIDTHRQHLLGMHSSCAASAKTLAGRVCNLFV